MRDDFSEEVKRTLAARVGNRCSNPSCRALTSGPQDNTTRALNVGVAAHITAASEGGARYNPDLVNQDRRHADNGIWLCQTCGKLVDNDPVQFPTDLLRAWKTMAHFARLRFCYAYAWRGDLSVIEIFRQASVRRERQRPSGPISVVGFQAACYCSALAGDRSVTSESMAPSRNNGCGVNVSGGASNSNLITSDAL
jgi:hypothetical protein